MLKVVGIDVDEDRLGADAGDAAGRREERERGGDDLVAWSDVERHQGRRERVGARGHADGVAHIYHRGDFALEGLDFGAHDESLAVGDTGERIQQRLAQRRELRLEVEQRNSHKPLIVLAWAPSAQFDRTQPLPAGVTAAMIGLDD